jgi:exonuclease SbcC
MKILAIRGKNLASLAGQFELRFQEEPLASTGLFAICGPTGSGKSTLLDALCLALYDETPRLTHAPVKNVSLPDVGDETISPQDPRNLLRRGASDGFAEVDFVGNDGISYRARWSVRRARNKATGKLQSTEMLLQTLEGERIGGLKNDVLAAIRDRLGLSFHQFTRAVLLAQNEFATFLKANDNERAELLETLTGLDIYRDISIRAFERGKAEQQVLEALKSQLASQESLAFEQRQQLEQGLATAKADSALLEQRKIVLDQQLQWHEIWEKLQQSEQQALGILHKAQTAQEAAAEHHAYLHRVETVQESRSFVTEVERAAKDTEKAIIAVSQAQEQLHIQRDLRRQAETALLDASQRVATAEDTASQAQSALNRAKELDAEIATLTPNHTAAAQALAEAQTVTATAQAQLETQQTARDHTAAELAHSQAWLAEQQSLRSLAEDWPRWDMLLDEAAKTQNGLREIERNITIKLEEEQQQRRSRNEAAIALTKAETAWQEAETRLQVAVAALAGFDADELAGRRVVAEIRREQIVSGERLWNMLTSSLDQQQKLDEEAQHLQEKIVRAETALAQLHLDKAVASAQSEQAEKSLKIAEAACNQNVEVLRQHLEADLPCPVCGAIEHPYAVGHAPSLAMLVQLQEEVAICRKAIGVLDRQEATRQTHLESHRQRRDAISAERAALDDAIATQSAAWQTHPAGLELSTLAAADHATWFAAENQAVRDQFAAITVEENARRQANKTKDEAQIACNSAQQHYSETRDTLNTVQATLDQALRALETTREQQIEMIRQLQERLSALDAAFADPDWRMAWQADAATFHRVQQEQALQWQSQQKTVAQLQINLGALGIEIKNITASVTEKTVRLERIAEVFTAADRDLQAKRQQRLDLFTGRPITEVEAEQAAVIAAAKRDLQQQDQAAKTAANQQASAEAILGQVQKRLEDSQQASNEAGMNLESWMAQFNQEHPAQTLDRSQLSALLSHDRLWLTQEREQLRQLADRLRDAEITLRDRRTKREEHEQQRPTPDAADTIHAEQKQIVLALEHAKQRALEMEIDLRRDDQRQAAAATLQEEIRKREPQTALWQKLDDLIGSATGTKFRNYAQQFTLDVLLSYANHHLTDLSRRYRLERVKDSLALMVVDQDMGDEYRSVHSLSGGESFLVSLALALGLASLSSNRVRVESLFIDEGFGSLDADTLRIAMDALDHLQAQGRKVGVISHVQDMTERIGIQIQVRRHSGGQSHIEVRSI